MRVEENMQAAGRILEVPEGKGPEPEKQHEQGLSWVGDQVGSIHEATPW